MKKPGIFFLTIFCIVFLQNGSTGTSGEGTEEIFRLVNLHTINNPQLKNLDGLESLEEPIGDIEIKGNKVLVDSIAFKKLLETPEFSATKNKCMSVFASLTSGSYRFILKKLVVVTTIPTEVVWVAADSIFYYENEKEREIRTYDYGRIYFNKLPRVIASMRMIQLKIYKILKELILMMLRGT